MRELFVQFGKFTVVGTFAFLVDYALLALLTEAFGIHYLASATIAYILATALNYRLSTRYVFGHSEMHSRQVEFLVFIGLSLGGLALNDFILGLLSGLFGIHYLISKVFASGCGAIYNFLSRRAFLSGGRKNAAARTARRP